MRIKGIDLQEETIFEVGKFAILWNWFERSWCRNNCNPKEIQKIANSIAIDAKKQALFAKILNERRYLFHQIVPEYVDISLHPPKARPSSDDDKEAMLQFMEQAGDKQTYGCLLILHRIRNNLMHGLKLLEELDGQVELFRAATAVLESMEEHY